MFDKERIEKLKEAVSILNEVVSRSAAPPPCPFKFNFTETRCQACSRLLICKEFNEKNELFVKVSDILKSIE